MCLWSHNQYACSCLGQRFIKAENSCPKFDEHHSKITSANRATSNLEAEFNFCCSTYCCVQRIIKAIKTANPDLNPTYAAVHTALDEVNEHDIPALLSLENVDAGPATRVAFLEHRRCKRYREGLGDGFEPLDGGYARDEIGSENGWLHDIAMRQSASQSQNASQQQDSNSNATA